MRRVVLTIVLLLLVPACANEPAVETASGNPVGEQVDLTPRQLGEIGAEISIAPARADEIVRGHGLTLEEFETEVRRVTANPESASEYATAFRTSR